MRQYSLIKEMFENSLLEASKTDANIANKLKNRLVSDTQLTNLWKLIENFERNDIEETMVDEYIQENIKMALQQKWQLTEYVKEAVKRVKPNDLNIAIGILLFEKKTPFNLHEYTVAYNTVKDHLTSISRTQREVNSMLRQSKDKMGAQEYDFLVKYVESQKKGENFAKKYIDESIKIVKSKINETVDLNDKVGLYEVKDELTSWDVNKVSYEQLLHVHNLIKSLGQ